MYKVINTTSPASASPLQESRTNYYSQYTGFHFHNFFNQASDLRFKMKTYGHASDKADTASLQSLQDDIQLMVNCVTNRTDPPDAKLRRVEGGFQSAQPFMPIYFQDEQYRQRRHSHVRKMVEEDKAGQSFQE